MRARRPKEIKPKKKVLGLKSAVGARRLPKSSMKAKLTGGGVAKLGKAKKRRPLPPMGMSMRSTLVGRPPPVFKKKKKKTPATPIRSRRRGRGRG